MSPVRTVSFGYLCIFPTCRFLPGKESLEECLIEEEEGEEGEEGNEQEEGGRRGRRGGRLERRN